MDINAVKSDIEEVLNTISFPAQKDEVVQQAKQHGASDDTMQALQKLPSQTFSDAGDLLSNLPFAGELESLAGKYL